MAFPSTFVDLQGRVIAKARLDATADLQKTKDWLNLSYFDAYVEFEIQVSVGTSALTSGTATYDLGTTTEIARIKDLFVTQSDVVSGPVQQVSIDKILMLRESTGGAPASTGTITCYALSGANTLDVYPTPQSADTITWYYVAFPTALSANSDVPDIQEPWATNLLEYGALVHAGEFKSDPQLAQWQQQSEFWRTRFREHLNRRRGVPGPFEFARTTAYPPHDPATIEPMV